MRSAIIGCGGIAQVHARSIRETEGADLIAAADIRPERAEKMAVEYGCRAYSDWQVMLETEKPEVVHICTPHYLHTPMALECLKRGIHVFTEKPPVVSYEQLEALKKEAAEAAEKDIHIAVCFQNRWNQDVQYAKEILNSGMLGEVIGARVFVTWNRGEGYYSDDWHGTKEFECGGALINQGIHTMDLMQYLIGERPYSADAMAGNFHLKGKIEVEDTLCTYIQYPKAAADLYVTTAYVTDSSPFVEIQCREGSLRMENGELLIRKKGEPSEVVTFEVKEGAGKACWGSSHRKAIGEFYDSIRKNTGNLLDLEQVQDSLKLLLDIYAAAENGRRTENL